MAKPDDNWRSNPYLFAAFHAAVSRVLDVLKPPGEIIPPPPSKTLYQDGLQEFRFPDTPQEHGRECADLMLRYMRHCSDSFERGHSPAIVGADNFTGENRDWIMQTYYGMADALRDLSLKIEDNRRPK